MKKIEENVYNIENSDIKEIFKIRNPESNKGDFGYIGILGGCENYSGAIKLANMSATALRAGCGVVRLIIPKNIENFVAPYLLEQTMYPYESIEDIKNAIQDLDSLAIGMGWDYQENHLSILKYVLENSEDQGRTCL